MPESALLALEDGSLFYGTAIGATGTAVGEVVFNTAMTGYQEILSDPVYTQRMVALTYPHIGNTGTNAGDNESDKPRAAALIIREQPHKPSNWQNEADLASYLAQNNIVAIADVDTRQLTRHIRDYGSLRGCVVTGEIDKASAIAQARDYAGIAGQNLVDGVTTKQSYTWDKPSWQGPNSVATQPLGDYKVAVYDFGVKRSLLSALVDRGAKVTVVPAHTEVKTLKQLDVDGVVLSNGPGDPAACQAIVNQIKQLIELGRPILGAGLGCQLLGLALGAETQPLKRGYYGVNHPLKNVNDGHVGMSSQAASFVIDKQSLPASLVASYHSLFDQSLQGFVHQDKPLIGFQANPEAGDYKHILDQFFALMAQPIEQTAHR